MIAKRLILCGFGNVGKAFTRLVHERKEQIRQRYALDLMLVAVVDIGGAAINGSMPLPAGMLLSHIENGGSVETFGKYGKPEYTLNDVLSDVPAEVLIETTPTNLNDGEPAYNHMLSSIDKGLDIVSANKGPLVLFYEDLIDRARSKGSRIFMSAATAAALPALDVGLLCLAGTNVISVEGILNGTTNHILTRMHFENCDYQTALQEAQNVGIAETDPALDVEGLDTRNKLLLISNQVFSKKTRLEEISVEGIIKITPVKINEAKKAGRIIKLIGNGVYEDGKLKLAVEPKQIALDHPLAGIHYSEKGISFLTDTMGRITVSGGQSSPVGAAAALLKDLIHSSMLV